MQDEYHLLPQWLLVQNVKIPTVVHSGSISDVCYSCIRACIPVYIKHTNFCWSAREIWHVKERASSYVTSDVMHVRRYSRNPSLPQHSTQTTVETGGVDCSQYKCHPTQNTNYGKQNGAGKLHVWGIGFKQMLDTMDIYRLLVSVCTYPRFYPRPQECISELSGLTDGHYIVVSLIRFFFLTHQWVYNVAWINDSVCKFPTISSLWCLVTLPWYTRSSTPVIYVFSSLDNSICPLFSGNLRACSFTVWWPSKFPCLLPSPIFLWSGFCPP